MTRMAVVARRASEPSMAGRARGNVMLGGERLSSPLTAPEGKKAGVVCVFVWRRRGLVDRWISGTAQEQTRRIRRSESAGQAGGLDPLNAMLVGSEAQCNAPKSRRDQRPARVSGGGFPFLRSPRAPASTKPWGAQKGGDVSNPGFSFV
jgi:hypothetical protein